MPRNDKKLTSGQAAKILDVPPRTLRRYLSTGALVGQQHPITGRWSVERHDVEELRARYEAVDSGLSTAVTVLIIGRREKLRQRIEDSARTVFPASSIEKVADLHAGLVRAGATRAEVVVLLESSGAAELSRVCAALEPYSRVLAILDPAISTASIEKTGADGVLDSQASTQRIADILRIFRQDVESTSK